VWHPCATINKYAGGTTTSTTVALQNTGTVPAQLSVIPSACSDSLHGAGAALCDDITVTVTCTPPATAVFSGTLNAFHAGRNWPTGYTITTALAAGATIDCTFALSVSTTPAEAGTVSQPISFKLTLG
jgi:hypothetical protein